MSNFRHQKGEAWEHSEEERKRIAEKLHHVVGQSLYSMLLLIKFIKHKNRTEELLEQLDMLESVTKETLETAVQLAKEIRPMILDDLGVIPAIRSYARWEQQRSGTVITFHADDEIKKLDPEVETALFRIFQEALHAALDEPLSGRIEIRLSGDQGVQLEVEQYGAAAKHAQSSGERVLCKGLREMERRVEALGGSVQTALNEQDGGFCIRVWFP